MSEPFCRHTASALLPWYINGVLGADEHARVREHVESCDVCATELADLETVVRGGAPPGFTRESHPQTVSPPGTAWTPARRAWVLAVVLLVPAILGVVWILLVSGWLR